MPRNLFFPAGFFLGILIGCSSPANPVDAGTGPLVVDLAAEIPLAFHPVLLQAEEFELIATDPAWPSEADRLDPNKFHGYGVRGRAKLEARALRRELLTAFSEGARENDGMTAACFDPRHALVAQWEGQTCEILVCFECLSFQVWDGHKHISNGDISLTPRAVFDQIYEAQGLVIAPR